MKSLIYLLSLFFCIYSIGQNTNLVPNPSFESNAQCPMNTSEFYYCSDWINPGTGSPDYFLYCSPPSTVGIPTNCCGYEYARTGEGYGGIFAYQMTLREYIQVQLTTPMIAGHAYHVEFFVSLADNAKYSISSMGAYLSANQITGNSNLYSYTPQIINPPNNQLNNKNGWTMVADTFIAAGGEEYLTLGNFNTTANSDTLFVGSPSTGWTAAYYLIDDVTVFDMDNPLSCSSLPSLNNLTIYPNPSTSGIFTFRCENTAPGQIEIFNSLGQQVSLTPLKEGSNLIQIQISEAGIFRYRILVDNEIVNMGMLIQ